MPPTRLQFCVVKRRVHRVLLVHDGGHRLERNPKENRLAVRNAALYAPGKICYCKNFSALCAKRVVVLASRKQNAAKAGTDFKRLGRGQA